VNDDVVGDEDVDTVNASRQEAESMGAIAFFGDKYGDRVRVVRAGRHSLEFCGGTHVHRLGEIGQLQIVSEASIGSGTRRIEAVTGFGALARSREMEMVLSQVSSLLKTSTDDIVPSLDRVLERQRELEKTISSLRQAQLATIAAELDTHPPGALVAQVDGYAGDQLRTLAQDLQRRGRAVVVLAGRDGDKVALVVATDGEKDAVALVKDLARHVQGGGGGSPTLALAGGRDAAGITAALDAARATLG